MYEKLSLLMNCMHAYVWLWYNSHTIINSRHSKDACML